MKQFTIGIPTYNRAPLLKEALACALGQTGSDVEVVVVDNGCVDDTPRLLSEYGPAVQVVRNERNQGALVALKQCLETAQTQYFSWLQDDDLLHPDLLLHARQAFARYPEATIYIPFAAGMSSRSSFTGAKLAGPPVGLGWAQQQSVRMVEGKAMLPFSFFVSIGIPPVLVYHRETIAASIPHWDYDCPLYWERMTMNFVLSRGPAVVEAFVAGVSFLHVNQLSNRGALALKADQDWLVMANFTDKLLQSAPDWESCFAGELAQVSPHTAQEWLHEANQRHCSVPSFLKAREILKRHCGNISTSRAFPNQKVLRALTLLREITPPILWRAVASNKTIRRFLKIAQKKLSSQRTMPRLWASKNRELQNRAPLVGVNSTRQESRAGPLQQHSFQTEVAARPARNINVTCQNSKRSRTKLPNWNSG